MIYIFDHHTDFEISEHGIKIDIDIEKQVRNDGEFTAAMFLELIYFSTEIIYVRRESK